MGCAGCSGAASCGGRGAGGGVQGITLGGLERGWMGGWLHGGAERGWCASTAEDAEDGCGVAMTTASPSPPPPARGGGGCSALALHAWHGEGSWGGSGASLVLGKGVPWPCTPAVGLSPHPAWSARAWQDQGNETQPWTPPPQPPPKLPFSQISPSPDPPYPQDLARPFPPVAGPRQHLGEGAPPMPPGRIRLLGGRL